MHLSWLRPQSDPLTCIHDFCPWNVIRAYKLSLRRDVMSSLLWSIHVSHSAPVFRLTTLFSQESLQIACTQSVLVALYFWKELCNNVYIFFFTKILQPQMKTTATIGNALWWHGNIHFMLFTTMYSCHPTFQMKMMLVLQKTNHQHLSPRGLNG